MYSSVEDISCSIRHIKPKTEEDRNSEIFDLKICLKLENKLRRRASVIKLLESKIRSLNKLNIQKP